MRRGAPRQGPKVATKALDSEAGTAGAKPPISLHPAFPAVVALWFAALLGFGMLLMPPILLDRAVELSRIGHFVPAAGPPLGFTARGLAAGVAAVLGAIAGLFIARQVSRAHTPTASPRFAASAARRPFNAHDELGDEGIAAPAPAPSKRRSLAIAEDSGPSDFLTLAPLPGEDRYAAPAPAPEPPAFAPPEAVAEEPLELSEVALEEAPVTFERRDPPQEPIMTDDAPVQFPSTEEIERRRAERRANAPSKSPGGLERRLYLRRTSDEAIPFIAPSLARRAPVNENAAGDGFAPPVAVRVSFAQPDASATDQACEAEEAYEVEDVAAEDDASPGMPDWETAPLEELGMIQLVQRLGASIERRRELAVAPVAAVAAAAAAPVAPAAPVLEAFDAAPAEEAAEAMAAYFGHAREEERAEAAPARMFVRSTADPVPTDDEAEEDDDLAASFSLPLRKAAVVPDPFADFDEPVADEDDDRDYGSLLSLRNPFQERAEEFVRVEEPAEADEGPQPAVIFPRRGGADAPAGVRPFDPPPAGGDRQAPPPPKSAADGEADEALRKALATLQRMSQSG